MHPDRSFYKVLVVAAHPDDEVLGCGGMIGWLLARGSRVRVLILGEGSSCRYPPSMLGTEEVRHAISQRQAFAEAALARLGVADVCYGELPCGRFDTVPIIDIGKQVERHLAEYRPDTVITHWGRDANSDHRLTFNAVVAATRPVPGASVKTVLSFETPSSTEWQFADAFRPSLFVDIANHLEAKIAAFDCYSPTEGRAFPFPRCREGLETLARYRGMQAGVAAAEAFEVVRAVLD